MRWKQSGFTLIEVLVVLVLTSLISLALFSSFRTGVHSLQIAEDQINKVEDSRQLLGLVRRHLLDIISATLEEGGVQVEAFEGDGGRIRYVAPLSMSAYGEHYLIELVSGLNNKPGIWMRLGRYKPGLSAEEIFEDSEFVLLSEDTEVEIYYLSKDDSGEPNWVTNWLHRLGMPGLVRMDVTRQGERLPSLTLRVGRT